MRNVLIVAILLIAAFLLFYRLADLMPFIGDQGWFYLSARDMLLTDNVPLVGITSSHTWLHQGALWTYMLAGALSLFHFNPVGGAYLSTVIGLITIGVLYKVSVEMFSLRVGLIAALFYATSPFIIFNERMAYHVIPIPLLTLLLFYSLYKWIKGYIYGFPLILFLLALLYNFELATFTMVPIVIIILVYGIIKKTPWTKKILDKNILLLSVAGLLIPLIPMILYDTHHGYPQTLKFLIWVGYKIATIFGYPQIHPDTKGETYQTMLPFGSLLIQRIIFLMNATIAWIILAIISLNLVAIVRRHFKEKKYLHPTVLLFLFFIIPSAGYIAEKTNSEAYVLVLFPPIAIMIGLLFDRLMQVRLFFIPAVCVLLLFASLNVYALFTNNFLMGKYGYGPTFQERLTAAKYMVREAKGHEYNIKAKGPWTQYESFTMNYQYLTWWLGHGPSQKPQKLQFIIHESQDKINVEKKVYN